MLHLCCPCLFSDSNHAYSTIPDSDPDYGGERGAGSVGTVKSSQGSSPGKPQASSPSASTAPTNSSNDQNIFRAMPDKDNELEFDPNASIFRGMVVQQKFFNKSSYDPKFVWVNLQTRSLCLSEHSIKERRHKEANIADITGVIAGPPEKYKASVNTNGEATPLNGELCLSVKFVRGGGIDLQFPSTQERDNWYQVLTRLILQEKELRRSSSGIAVPSGSTLNKQ